MRILLIDDEEVILKTLSVRLEAAGYEVVCAADGFEGLKSVRSARPDLVVLDVMLPGIDGLAVCRAMRADALTREIPVLMLSARVSESDRKAGLESGADLYMPKPFQPQELLCAVKSLLSRPETGSAPAHTD